MDRRRPRRTLFACAAFAVLASVACSDDGSGDDADGDGDRQALDTAGCTTDTRSDPETKGDNHVDRPGYGGPLSNPPTYAVNPPSGGDHLGGAAPAGVYTGANIPPDGILVHSLEHGYVILWYRSDAPADEVATVREAAQKFQRDTLVVERKDMPVAIAATAWEQRLLCQEADADTLADFIERYRNQGPEKVPH